MSWLNIKWRTAVALLACLPAITLPALAETYTLQSPDGHLHIAIDTSPELTFAVTLDNIPVIRPSTIGMEVEGLGNIAHNIEVTDQQHLSKEATHTPVIAHKNAQIHEHYRGLTLSFSNGFGVQFRAYNDGAAYRFIGDRQGDIQVIREPMRLNFPERTSTLFPEEESLISHYERSYIAGQLAEFEAGRFASLPVYFKTNGINVVFTEADLFDYPGLFIEATGTDTVTAKHPAMVAQATPTPGSEDRNQQISFARAIAQTHGQRSFPWRLAIINQSDAKLVESELVWLLSRENQLTETGWIKPGRVAWDWYNANNLFGVDFKAGLNTQTYKYYIDFAADYGLEYVILDEGWTRSTTNLTEHNPDIDVHELIRYGKDKGVGIILWALWGPLDKDYQRILKTYGEWGAAGIKVDFMQRADQYMVNFYEKIAREAAKNRLLVDFHGGFKPSGLRRAYPNVLTYEGVKGNENNKWSQDITPEHTVTLPFTRMLAGPMDFTPGALRNAHLPQHHISHFRPVSLGTRAHQVAMYAVYESALQMLCESPSTYRKEPEVTGFIAQFPSVWDETRVLDASVANYIVVARRRGDTWYLGAMTDNDPRTLKVNFEFLGEGEFTLDLLRDGINTQHYAEDYKREQIRINAETRLSIQLAGGGGWAGIIKKR